MSAGLQTMGKSVMRVAKNSIKGYSDTQTKVRDATSNDPWGPSGTQMAELAQLTYNQQDFVEIIEMLDKRLNDKGKNWRHVFKSLTVLDYILHAGSENVVQYFRENLYVVKTLKEFQYIDEYGKDQGANVRQKAKDITNLLLDENRMRSQRASRKDMRNRMAGRRTSPSRNERPSRATPPPGGAGGDADLQAAIEASKRSAEEEARRKRGGKGEDELEEALRLSREEEERRQRELAANGGGNLFDEQQRNANALIDMDAPTVQQPMQTGWMSFNPYQAQQQAQMEEYMRQQQLLELQRQQEQQQMMYQQQQAAMQQQYQQQQAYEDYMRQQQMLYMQQQAQQPQQQAIQPQPTGFGANNPFAAFASPPPASSPAPPQSQASTSSAFGDSFQPEPAAPSPAPQPQQPQRTGGGRFKATGDDKHADLARMLGAGREDGLDTFGNIGSARVPVWQQKTGQQVANGQGPLAPQTTGLAKPLNPFGNVTGNYQAPTQFNQPTGFQQQQQKQDNEQPFFTI
ncbi:hypothetical protein NBRC10512_004941 [Rhodotorula toruloides]|uniref:RHTO0S01e13256g1_1 n=2 Tax=Rhodotorula toruloides TaxID=5286 RepID=A0A061AEW2_RHOTO|nr:Epsin domain protein [Rhodotorula toruloides NP11]EMS24491.1 Epsin domain protein [Rhodotorula toruloides NP11]CDR36057.1 RHTO0S01e13256g1_1 [Rhodotorula toruloides]